MREGDVTKGESCREWMPPGREVMGGNGDVNEGESCRMMTSLKESWKRSHEGR